MNARKPSAFQLKKKIDASGIRSWNSHAGGSLFAFLVVVPPAARIQRG